MNHMNWFALKRVYRSSNLKQLLSSDYKRRLFRARAQPASRKSCFALLKKIISKLSIEYVYEADWEITVHYVLVLYRTWT